MVFGGFSAESLRDRSNPCAHGTIEGGTDIKMCPDAMSLRLTGKSPEEVFPTLALMHADP